MPSLRGLRKNWGLVLGPVAREGFKVKVKGLGCRGGQPHDRRHFKFANSTRPLASPDSIIRALGPYTLDPKLMSQGKGLGFRVQGLGLRVKGLGWRWVFSLSPYLQGASRMTIPPLAGLGFRV